MVNLRRVELSDLPQLREIVSTAFKHHRFWVDNKLDQDKVKEFYIKSIDKMVKDFFENSDKRDFIVAVEDEKIVGYITSLIDDERTSIFGFRWGVIWSFALREGYRQKGLGSKMLEKALEWFASKNVSQVDVWTDSENIPAIQCYEKAGFRVIYSGVTLTLNMSKK